MSRDPANIIRGYERFKIQAQCFTWENGWRSMVWKEKWERFLRVQHLTLIHMYIVNMKTVLPQAVERTSSMRPAEDSYTAHLKEVLRQGQQKQASEKVRNFESWHFHPKQIIKIWSWIQELKCRSFESKEIIEDVARYSKQPPVSPIPFEG